MFSFRLLKANSAIFFLCIVASPYAFCNSSEKSKNTSKLFNMSLEELLSTKVSTSNLTDTALNKSPSAITIITHEQMERTPARNLIDILQTYVPGLLVISDFASGPRLRMRGLGERHNHTLLLVNGKPVNQKAHQGSMVELRNWDMTDIDRVEVVRGAGSVTHGPGAISGVINIITKEARNENGLKLGADYNHTYDSQGVKLSYAKDISDSKLFFHSSYTQTKGASDYDIYQIKATGEQGYKGTDAFTDTDANPLQNYYSDYDENPQIKLYLDVDINDEWRFWARYNNSGQTNTSIKREIQDEMQNWRQFEDRYYIFSLENFLDINQSLTVKSILSYDSEDYIETKAKQADLPNTHELNRSHAFSEDEIYFRTTLDYHPTESLSLATALEYSYDTLSSPWEDPDSSFLANTGKQVFISEDSVYLGDGKNGTYEESRVAEFTNGWSVNTYSAALELKYLFTTELEGIVSGRVDKNDLTESMYSPRLALIYQFDEQNIVKASWQRSLRMNTMVELYWLDINNKEAEPEQTTTYELAYSRLQGDNLHFAITGFYNDSEIIAWDGSNANLVGVIKAYGIEPEISYRTETFSFGANHSFFELIDWDFQLKEDDGSVLQNISYSDMLYTRDYLTLTSTGDSLTDWVQQHTKLWLDTKLSDNWTLHMNTQIIWKYEYGNDLFNMYDKAYAQVDTSTLSTAELNEYNENKAFLEEFNQTVNDKETYDKDIRFNASVTWNIPSIHGVLTLYGQNLINFTDNKRQQVNFTTKTLPSVSWVEEPRTVGLKYSQQF